jgi:hypothetical protein
MACVVQEYIFGAITIVQQLAAQIPRFQKCTWSARLRTACTRGRSERGEGLAPLAWMIAETVIWELRTKMSDEVWRRHFD